MPFHPSASKRPIKMPVSGSTSSIPKVKGVGIGNLVTKVSRWKQENPGHDNLTIKGVVTLWKVTGKIDSDGNPKGGS